MRRTIAVAGSLAQRPGAGGHAWVFLQYLLGFKRLGWDVLFLDRLDEPMCVDRHGQRCDFEVSENRRYLLEVMQHAGLQNSFSLDFNHGQQVLGLPRDQVLGQLSRAPLLINVMGFLEDPEYLGSVGSRAFLDIDPGFGQMWQALGLCELFRAHDFYVTIGLNIGRAECLIPTCNLPWVTTLQPVVLTEWPNTVPPPSSRCTSIVSWRGPFGPIDYQGERFGLRVHEFRRFMELPQVTGNSFELALDIHPGETGDISLLRENGWLLVDPKQVAYSLDDYRSYIQNSAAEFMVAKEMYVKAKSGWISDRSICYLASGRPVLAQDTHLQHLFPDDKGLILFSSLDEATRGAVSITKHYAEHTLAARALAEQHFDSDIVLTRLLAQLGID